MKRRHRMHKHHSRKHFSHHAAYVHRKNLLSGSAMLDRGGIRL